MNMGVAWKDFATWTRFMLPVHNCCIDGKMFRKAVVLASILDESKQ